MKENYAPVYPHDPIVEIFENIYLLRGSIQLGFGLSMNRNMIIIKQNNELTLINAVRMFEAELEKLEALGAIKHLIQSDAIPPIKNAEFFIFEQATCPEAILYIEDKKLLITTDSIQYWSDWKYFSFLSKIIIYLMGFRLGLFIGGPWLKRVTPKSTSLKNDFDRLLQLDFQHLVAAHGTVLIKSAKEELVKVVKKQFGD